MNLAYYYYIWSTLVYVSIDEKQQWIPTNDLLELEEWWGINRNKMILIIVWNFDGFHILDDLPNGEIFCV
jgi:hypothetical protein